MFVLHRHTHASTIARGLLILAVLSFPGSRLAAADKVELHEKIALIGHKYRVSSVGFLNDGKSVLSGSWDGTVKQWNLETGKELRTVTGLKGPILSIAILPDGKQVVTGSWDGTVKVWEIATGKERSELRKIEAKDMETVLCVACAPNGKTVAAGTGWFNEEYTGFDTAKAGQVILWDLETKKELARIKAHKGMISALAFSVDGKMLASGSSDGTAVVHDASGDKELWRLPARAGALVSLAFSPDSQTLATICGPKDKKATVSELQIWDLKSGKEKTSFKAEDGLALTGVAFSPDNSLIALGSMRGTIRLVDAVSGKERCQVVKKGQEKWPIPAVCFSPDGKLLVSGCWDPSVTIWEVK